MAVPDFQTLMRPLLSYAQDGQEKNIGEAIKALADEFVLSENDRTQMLPTGKQTLLGNRAHWARTYLAKADAIKRTRRSHFIITERGKASSRATARSSNKPLRLSLPDGDRTDQHVPSRAGCPQDACSPMRELSGLTRLCPLAAFHLASAASFAGKPPNQSSHQALCLWRADCHGRIASRRDCARKSEALPLPRASCR